MFRILTASTLALSLVAGLPGAASAQSYTAPAGIPAVTAPGGLDGIADASNLGRRSYQSAPRDVSVETIDTTGSVHAPQAARGRTTR